MLHNISNQPNFKEESFLLHDIKSSALTRSMALEDLSINNTLNIEDNSLSLKHRMSKDSNLKLFRNNQKDNKSYMQETKANDEKSFFQTDEWLIDSC